MKNIKNKIVLAVAALLFTTLNTAQCFTDIYAGYNFAYAKKANGTIWGWGANGNYTINATGIDEYLPVQVGNSTNWKTIACGYQNSFIIDNNNALWASGDNEFGCLGLGFASPNVVDLLTQVGTATDWKQISANDNFTLGIKLNGTLWSWGYNGNYQLGTTGGNRSTPLQVGTATNWKMTQANQLACGMAVKTDGTLWGWGANGSGLLGDSTVQGRAVPTQLNPDTNWKSISSTYGHVLALKTDNTLWAWGSGDYGQCGDNLPLSYFRDTPQQVGTATWQVAFAAKDFSLGIKPDGTLWAWGKNNINQLGDGTTTNRVAPVQIGTDTDWATVSSRASFVILLKNDGSMWAWGQNNFGQLGNGTTTPELTAVNIPITGCALATENFTKQVNTLTVSPNPAGAVVTLDYNGQSLVNQIYMYDLQGKEVYKSEPFASTTLKANITTAQLQSGTYIVVLKNNGVDVASAKMIKE